MTGSGNDVPDDNDRSRFVLEQAGSTTIELPPETNPVPAHNGAARFMAESCAHLQSVNENIVPSSTGCEHCIPI